MTCRVTSTAKSGCTARHRLRDRHGPRQCVMHTRLVPLQGNGQHARAVRPLRPDSERQRRRRSGQRRRGRRGRSTPPPGTRYRCPATPSRRRTPRTATTRQPVFAALRADRPVHGREQWLRRDRQRRARPAGRRPRADDDVRRRTAAERRADRPARPAAAATLTLALGFGRPAAAVGTAGASAATRFDRTLPLPTRLGGLRQGPQAAAAPAAAGRQRGSWPRTYYLSANVLKASEDKTFPGAIVASLASPWGQAVSAGDPAQTYFGSYREVFARDLYETFTGLLATGDLATAKDTVRFLFERQQQPDGSMPRNSPGQRQDRARLVRHPARRGGLPDPDGPHGRPDRLGPLPRPHQAGRRLPGRARPAFGASAGRSRAATRRRRSPPRSPAWPRPGRSPTRNGDAAGARIYRATADHYQRNIKAWTVTTDRPAQHPAVLHPAVQDRRPERRDHLRPRQRRSDRRPAVGHRRRVPRAAPARRPAGRRRRRRSLARHRRPGDRDDHQQRHRLLPLRHRHRRHRGRLRRLLHRRHHRLHRAGQAVGRHCDARTEPGLGSPVAGAVRRARRAASSPTGDPATAVAAVAEMAAPPPASA